MYAIFLLIFSLVCLADVPAPATDTDIVVVDTDSQEPVTVVEPTATPATVDAPAADTDEPAPGAEVLTTEDALALLPQIIAAAKSGNWGLLIALVLMVVVYVLKTFVWKKLPKEAVPYVTIGVTSVTSFSAAILAGSSVADSVLIGVGGLLMGLSAIGVWEVLGKKIFKKPDA